MYAPNKDDPEFFVNTIELAPETVSKRIIIGDFNLVIDNKIDRRGIACNNEKAAEVVRKIMQDLMMCDVWRDRYPQEARYTYFKKNRGRLEAVSRIDFALTSYGLDKQVINATYLPGIMTDHSAMYIALDTIEQKRGVGYWKFNNALLTNQKFLAVMNNFLECKLLE